MASSSMELWILAGSEENRFPIPGRVTLGRDASCDLTLGHRALSRTHCRLEPHREGLKLNDLNSTNGVQLDGRLISQAILRPGVFAWITSDVCLQAVPAGERPAAWPESLVADEVPDDAEPDVVVNTEVRGSTKRPPMPAAPAPSRFEAERVPEPRRAPRRPTISKPAVASMPDPVDRSSAGSNRPVRAAPRKASNNWVLYVGLALGLVGISVLMMSDGESPHKAAQQKLLKEATAREETRHYGQAANLLKDLVALDDSTPLAKKVGKRIDALLASQEEADVVENRLKAIANEDDPGARYARTMARFKEAAREAQGILPEGRTDDLRIELRRNFQDRSSMVIQRLASQVETSITLKRYQEAYEALTDAEQSGLLLDTDVHRCRDYRKRLSRSAEQALRRTLQAIVGVRPETREDRLRRALPSFVGTPYEGDLRARIALAKNAASISDQSKPATAEATPENPARTSSANDLLQRMTKVELLIGERKLKPALVLLDELIADLYGADQDSVEARRVRVHLMDVAIAGIREAISSSRAAFRNISVGGATKGRVLSTNDAEVEIQIGDGARVRWRWNRLSPDRLVSLAIRAGLTDEAGLGVAVLLLEVQAPKAAEKWLARQLSDSPGLSGVENELAAEARGMAEVPPDGFYAVGERLLTKPEKQEAELLARLLDLSQRIEQGNNDQMMSLGAQLLDLGDRGKGVLSDALKARVARFKSECEQVASLGKGLAAIRTELYGLLLERRKKALALIFDTQRYPYPYGPNGAKVQAEVDALVQAVRDVWEAPAVALGSLNDEYHARLQAMRDTEAYAASVELEPCGSQEMLSALNEQIGMSSFIPDNKVQGRVARDTRVHEYNAALCEQGIMSKDELECYQVTNAYREMFGLGAVQADERLVKCARGHSEEMHELKYFAHSSPVAGRKSPGDRAQLAGWGGSVSENIARGQTTGAGAVGSWIHSSGHHRNILGKSWTHLGVGKAKEATFWTQNFARGGTKVPPIPKPKDEEEKGK